MPVYAAYVSAIRTDSGGQALDISVHLAGKFAHLLRKTGHPVHIRPVPVKGGPYPRYGGVPDIRAAVDEASLPTAWFKVF